MVAREGETQRFFPSRLFQGVIINSYLSSLIRLILIISFIWPFFLSESASADSLSDRLNTPVDLVLLVDSSASMRLSDPGQVRKKAVAGFVGALGTHDRIALAEFSDSARLLTPFESPSSSPSLASQIASLGDSGEYTDILAAINLASKVFRDNSRAGVRKIVVLLSDGKMDPSPQQYSSAQATNKLFTSVIPELKSAGIVIHSIALSDEADRGLMSEIAVRTDGVGWFAKDAEVIPDILRDLLLVAKRPTDGEFFAKTVPIEREERVTIYVRKIPGSQIAIWSPSRKLFKKGESFGKGEQWFENEEFIVLTLEKPELGEWSVEGLRDPDEFVELLRDLKATVRWPSALFVGSQALVEGVLLEGSRPIAVSALSRAMRATVQIVSTDRIAEPLINGEMFDDGTQGDGTAEDGVFSREVVVDREGSYKVRVTLRGPSFEESAEQPFRVSRVLMRSIIDYTDKPFPKLVKGYQKSGDDHGGAAQGSHGAGGEEEHELAATPHDEVSNSLPAHDSEIPVTGDSVGDQKQLERDKNPVIRIELEREVYSFKRHEVSVVVVDPSGREYPIKLYPSRNLPSVLLGDLSDLPHVGEYQAQARLRVKPKWGAEQQYLGPWIPFQYSGKREFHEAVDEVETEEPETVHFGGMIGLVVLVNLLIGVGFFLLLKRQSKDSPVGGGYSLPSGLEEMVSKLEFVANESEITLDDPRLLKLSGSIGESNFDSGSSVPSEGVQS